MHVFLNGTAMRGGGDHAAIADSTFLAPARTAPKYRFYSVRDEFPGLVPDPGGASILGELYEVDARIWHDSLLPQEPNELIPGEIELDDGSIVHAMILDLSRMSTGEYRDITEFGGWRSYLAATRPEGNAVARTS